MVQRGGGTRAVWLGVLFGVTLAAQSPAVQPLADKDHRRMQPEAALDFSRGNTIVVAGDPAKPGLYAIRRLFKPGETSLPHYHDQDRYLNQNHYLDQDHYLNQVRLHQNQDQFDQG